jgi:uncharacterized protein involved in tolerance to divalent cations
LREALKQVHPYDTPSIVVIPADSVDADYYRWILQETENAG